jgi:hypothetical protein
MASPDEWFNGNLKAFRDGTLARFVVFDLGLSPQLHLKKLPRAGLFMPQSVVRKAVQKHGIDLDLLKNLPSAIQSPEKLFHSKSDPNSMIFVTPIRISGEALVAVAEYGRHPDFGMIYLVKSIHPRPSHHFVLWEQEGLMCFKKE